MPLAISDSSLLLLLQLASPLAQDDRSRFLSDVAALLKGEPEPIGDGAVGRAARAAQAKYLRPVEAVEIRRVARSRIPGARLSKPTNGNGSGDAA